MRKSQILLFLFVLSLLPSSVFAQRVNGNGGSPAITKGYPESSFIGNSNSPNRYPALVPVMEVGNKPLPCAKSSFVPIEKGMERAGKLAVTSDGTELWGNVIYSSLWQSSYESGIYSFNVSADAKLKSVVQNGNMKANAGGAFYDGKFHFIRYQFVSNNELINSYFEFNVSDWTQTSHSAINNTDFSLMSVAETIDPVSGNVYGEFFDSTVSSFEFGVIDYDNMSRTTIAPMTRRFLGMAADSKGQLYGIDINGGLYKIDKSNGSLSLVGSTGVKASQYIQSMTIDPKTDKLYWAAYMQDKSSFIYQVDLSNANTEQIAAFSGNEEITCLYVPNAETADAAPSKVTDLAVKFTDENTDGNVSFTIPTTTYDGNTLQNDVDYTIMADGLTLKSGTAKPGAAVNEAVSVTKTGSILFTVVLHNASGYSPAARTHYWVGYDIPSQVYNVKLTADASSGVVNLQWNAPQTGEHGGFVDRRNVVYDIVRFPQKDTVAHSLAARTYSETLNTDNMTVYSYEIIPINHGLRGEGLRSNSVVLGTLCAVPYYEPFDESTAFDAIYKVVDANDDYYTWKYTSEPTDDGGTNGFITYDGNEYVEPDDWLLTPLIKLKSNRQYSLSFDSKCSSKFLQLSAAVGQKDDASDMKTVLNLDKKAVDSFQNHKGTVRVAQDGNYRVGFHVTGAANKLAMDIDNIRLDSAELLASSDSVTNLDVKAAAEGALSATIAFSAPSNRVDGTALSALKKIDIYRNDSILVKTIDSPSLGENISFVDNGPSNGFNTYTVVPFNETQEAGVKASRRVYVGIDIPDKPRNVVIKDNVDGTALITWDAPASVGVNGGYVDTDELTYNIVNLKSNLYVKKHYDKRSITVSGMSEEGSQSLFRFAVNAESEAGEGDFAVTDVLLVGEPYTLPFTEQFDNGVPSHTMWWMQFNSSQHFNILATDGTNDVGGCAQFMSTFNKEWSSLCTGKVSLAGSKHPVLVFDCLMPNKTYVGDLRVIACSPAKAIADTILVEDIQASPHYGKSLGNGFYRMALSLDKYAADPYVVLKFRANNVEGYSFFEIDNVDIRDVVDNNLKVDKVSATGKLILGKTIPVAVRVKNIGGKDADGFVVKLTDESGNVLAHVDGDALGSTLERTYTVMLPTKVTDASQMKVKAVVDYPEDGDNSDNEMDYSFDLTKPTSVKIDDLSAEIKDGDDVKLSWTTPKSVYSFTDDFESYTPWIIDNIGDWTVVDVDGGHVSYANIPNAKTYEHRDGPYAYIVYNPSDIGIDLNYYVQMQPHSGNQYLASFSSSSSVANDDWLISPVLPGTKQTLDFYTRAIGYQTETYEVLTSSTDTNISSFSLLQSYSNGNPESWTLTSVDLPLNTKYFAIRETSHYQFALFVDDISFTRGEMPLYYNVYRDGKLIGTCAVDVTSYTDKNEGEQQHTYNVTAVYPDGESDLSNSVSISTSIGGLRTPVCSVRGMKGYISIENNTGSDVSIYTSDGKEMYHAMTAGSTNVAASRGVYVVRINGKSFNIVVR